MRHAVVFLLLAGCGQEFTFRGPAPPGALRCALAHAEAAGYELVEGGFGAQSLLLVQPLEPVASDRILPRNADPGRARPVVAPPAENRLIIEVAREELRLTVTTINELGEEVAPAADAEDHARTIFAMCTSAPPVLPDGSVVDPGDAGR